MIKLNLNENFISRIWENKSYYSNLETIDGKKVEVISPGIKNRDEGPDYSNATIKINDFLQTGDVEIHKNLKDWSFHNHKNKGKYDKVILQVVMWDTEVTEKYLPEYSNSKKISTVILSKFLTKSIHTIWREIIENPSKEFRIPCYSKNGNIEVDKKLNLLENMGLKRFHYRSKRIKDRFEILKNSGLNENIIWKKLLMEFIFEALGFSKNKSQFLKLGKLILFENLFNNNFTQIHIDALLFGIAGFLDNASSNNQYAFQLKSHWQSKMNKFSCGKMDSSEWNFFRLRPQNFPTVRIAYASGLSYSILYNSFFEKLIISLSENKKIIKNLFSLFKKIEISIYWQKNYSFDKPSKLTLKPIGAQRVHDIIINVVLPLIFEYALQNNNEKLCNLILKIYSSMKDESKNEITRTMENQFHIKIKKAIESQGAIHLHNFYCVKGKCDFCNIGKNVFVKDKPVDYLRIILY